MFGISPGGLLSDAEAFGNLDNDRTAMFVEAIDTILKLWTSEAPYDIKGKYWSISTRKTFIPEIGQGMVVLPYQKPHPPIVVTVVAPFSKGVTAAAERGWLPISANFLQPKWVASHWPMYAEGRKRAGAAPDPKDWRVARSIFVADDKATAERYGKGLDGPYAHYYKSLMRKLIANGRADLFKTDRAMPDAAVTLEFALDALVIAGTVESVVEQLFAFREVTGDFGTLVYAGHDWKDARLGRRSMELFAAEVMPRLNRAIAASAVAAD
jgi:alkanesulfonate monooxygenase SsuD/methylene tetrahydromethanopterin reductase-like flavin-dependent oxidoreductase (luciferase family)